MISRFVLPIFSVWLVFLGAHTVTGESYPNKPIRIVVSGVGGGGDSVVRFIAQGLSESVGQQVVVDNRPGAGGEIAIQTVAKALPDGYTLLVYSNGMWTLPLMRAVTYDPIKEFSPITIAMSTPSMIAVHPSVPVVSVRELIALAKAKPRDLNYGSGETGSSTHLAVELFKAMASVNIVHIPYKSAGQAIIDLIGGQVQIMIPNAPLGIPHWKSGRLKALAATSARPSVLLPGLPTVAASGLPDYEAVSVFCIFVPAKTPVTLVNRLNQEIIRVINQAEAKDLLLKLGVEAVGSSPGELTTMMKSEMVRMGKVIKDANIRAE